MSQKEFLPQEPLNSNEWIAAIKKAQDIRRIISGIDLEIHKRQQVNQLRNLMNKLSGIDPTAGAIGFLPQTVSYGRSDGSLNIDIWDKPPQSKATLQIRRSLITDGNADSPIQVVEIFDFYPSETFIRSRLSESGFIEWEPNPQLDSIVYAQAPTLQELETQLIELFPSKTTSPSQP